MAHNHTKKTDELHHLHIPGFASYKNFVDAHKYTALPPAAMPKAVYYADNERYAPHRQKPWRMKKKVSVPGKYSLPTVDEFCAVPAFGDKPLIDRITHFMERALIAEEQQILRFFTVNKEKDALKTERNVLISLKKLVDAKVLTTIETSKGRIIYQLNSAVKMSTKHAVLHIKALWVLVAFGEENVADFLSLSNDFQLFFLLKNGSIYDVCVFSDTANMSYKTPYSVWSMLKNEPDRNPDITEHIALLDSAQMAQKYNKNSFNNLKHCHFNTFCILDSEDLSPQFYSTEA